MLSSQLVAGGAMTFAKCCKSLRRVQRPQDAKAQQRRRLAGCFAQNFFCKIFMIQTAQAGAV
ncbi:hypothetical protein UN86_06920 [Escherichia coli]|nr:hypothetical protein [Escherichia coli]EFN8420745.1 hypothetical protein [Escherichia coli O145]QCH89234.1 hypothetical protein CCU02_019590 [Escherichia coli O45:H2]EFA5494046.1 hypothetical protein [Escherichia coli]EFA5503670.1 hypothetical protein [Escherichia coli]